MSLWEREDDTPMIEAVVRGDLETVKALMGQKKQVLAESYLGFNAIEMARYLNKKECIELLDPEGSRTFKVKPKGEDVCRLMDVSQLETFFNIRYLRNVIFYSYSHLKEVIRACPEFYRAGEELGEKANTSLFKRFSNEPEQFAIFAKLHKEKIHKGYFVPVSIEWVEEAVGYGIFAQTDIKKGGYVGEYTGEMKRAAFWGYTCDYAIRYPSLKRFYIDATACGNESRFLNHSYNSNLLTVAADQKGFLHCVFIAKKDISRGQQLTWNYGEGFWDSRDPPQEL